MNRFLFIICFGFNFLLAQQVDIVDFKSAKVNIFFNDLVKKQVIGTVVYEFEILKDADSIYLDAKNFQTINYVLNGKYKGELYNGKQLIVKHEFKANTKYALQVTWETQPKKALYFIDWEYEEGGNKQVWTQGQGKYTSNWLPSIDDMNEKIEFDLSVTFDSNYQVIANGNLVDKEVKGSTTTWHYDMQHPMSSYLVGLAIGNYDKKVEYSNSGIPLEMYYYPKDSLKFEPTYRYTKRLFDFLEDEIGVPYPWQNYKQVPVKDFLYAGMENTSTTIFSDAFVIDSIAFVDKNYVNVNAHELAHQWFGDLVTETSGRHHWLQEGFATYYALLAEREVFGDSYYFYKLFEYAQELKMQDEAGAGTALLNPKSSSTTFYKKGAWVLVLLRDKVGDKAFEKGVKTYLKAYRFKNVSTVDFIKTIEKTSHMDLSEFVDIWLKSDDFHYNDLKTFLSNKSNNYRQFFELDCKNSKESCLSYLETSDNNYLRSEVVNIMQGEFPKILYNSKDIKLRQALAQSVYDIPFEQKSSYESFLKDESYMTLETALFNLWRNFPLERKKYLHQTKEVQGFSDKNVRILWLTLAFITNDYNSINKRVYFNELTSYTSPKYGFEIRQNAFSYLNQIQACKEVCKENLKEATNHHNWRFKKFAKELLKAE
ncbi:M1 family metallopeptidase [uncultured Algibacter sp.]|uniref:M1 family metallopeptidase n=1 Tax=uncultured Algibacter sp. TaxID=298659 RepID=UPI00262E4E49|nr:M1 family metallopeptidase [uncultured Algibacter sp.]